MGAPASAANRLVLLRGGTSSDDGTTDPVGGAPADPSGVDVQLAMALIRGDRDATHRAWLRFSPHVRGNLRRILGPGADEDDLGQEVFLCFFRRVGGLREPAAVRGFLFAICLRVAQKELRRRWLRRWLRLTDDGALPETAAAGRGAESDDGEQEAREAVTRYYAILNAVGGQNRSLFVTRYIERLELIEVARLHGLSVSTTQRRLGRVAKRVDAMVRRDPLLAEIAGRSGRSQEQRR